MDLGLQGKSVLVAASSRGLGKASALAFAQEGAKVTIASRNVQELAKAAEEIRVETGQKVHTVPMDVTRPEEILRCVQEAAAFANRLDVLVTNAGGPPAGYFTDFSDEDWDRAFQLNLMSAVRLIRASLPYMREKKAGRIVAITSSSIKQPISGLILSNTFRAGIYALVKSLAEELAGDGILVNTVAPGRIATERVAELDQNKAKREGVSVKEVQSASIARIPVGRYGTPEEFARMVVFLGSFANTYVTGQAVLVDGGMVRAL